MAILLHFEVLAHDVGHKQVSQIILYDSHKGLWAVQVPVQVCLLRVAANGSLL